MQKRKLGNLEVSAIGVGCMGFSHGYGKVPEADYSINAMRKSRKERSRSSRAKYRFVSFHVSVAILLRRKQTNGIANDERLSYVSWLLAYHGVESRIRRVSRTFGKVLRIRQRQRHNGIFLEARAKAVSWTKMNV